MSIYNMNYSDFVILHHLLIFPYYVQLSIQHSVTKKLLSMERNFFLLPLNRPFIDIAVCPIALHKKENIKCSQNYCRGLNMQSLKRVSYSPTPPLPPLMPTQSQIISVYRIVKILIDKRMIFLNELIFYYPFLYTMMSNVKIMYAHMYHKSPFIYLSRHSKYINILKKITTICLESMEIIAGKVK